MCHIISKCIINNTLSSKAKIGTNTNGPASCINDAAASYECLYAEIVIYSHALRMKSSSTVSIDREECGTMSPDIVIAWNAFMMTMLTAEAIIRRRRLGR